MGIGKALVVGSGWAFLIISAHVEDVCAIIVTFNPSHQRLASLIEAITPQVRRTIVVDNASESLPTGLSAELVRLPFNLGLGAAHNIGMSKAKPYEFGLLLDQDSTPAPDMVAELVAAYRSLTDRGYKIAALGPNYFDLTSREWMCHSGEEAHEVLALGSSGSLIPSSIFEMVGPFREDFFIDYVDFEWCLRAAAHGRCFIIRSAQMTHELGTDNVFLLGHRVYYGGLARLYYIFRNATYLYTHSSYPLKWKYRDVKGKALTLAAAALGKFPDRATQTLPRILKGIFHGLIGRLGQL